MILIDDEDYEAAHRHKWYHSHETRHSQPVTYAMRRIKSAACVTGYTSQRIHTFLTGWPLVDHINHDGLDNRRSNLRPATTKQNVRNSRSRPGSSQYKGVDLFRGVKWRATIRVDGKKKHLGLFVDEKDAARAYNKAALELFGEFACLNSEE